MSNGNIEIENLPALIESLSKVSGTIQEQVFQGMQKTGLDIINDAKRNLTTGRINNTGFLRSSGRVEVNKNDRSVEVGFFGTGINQGYAYYIENGRRPGKFPPLWNIREWAYKKFRTTTGTKVINGRTFEKSVKKYSRGEELDRAVFLIARKIARKGTQAKRFFQPAVDRRLYDLERNVRNLIKDIIG